LGYVHGRLKFGSRQAAFIIIGAAKQADFSLGEFYINKLVNIFSGKFFYFFKVTPAMLRSTDGTPMFTNGLSLPSQQPYHNLIIKPDKC